MLRGLAVLNMVIFHLFYDLVYIYGYEFDWFMSRASQIWQQSIAWTFILVAGFSFNLTRKYFKHAFTLVLFSTILTLVTYYLMPEEVIWFGILHFLATTFIITWLTQNFLQKINPWIGIFLALALFYITRNIYSGYLNFFNYNIMIPEAIYTNKYLFWLGFPLDNFSSSDYFPLLPWFFLYIVGFFIGKLFRLGKISVPKFPKKNNILTFLGQNSLIIYLLHQPIIIGLMTFIKIYK